MRRKTSYILIVVILISLGVILYLHYNLNIHSKCPDEYANTDKGSIEYQKDLDKWTNRFYDTYPSATLSDWNKARYQFWVDNDCKEALRRYKEVKDGNANPNKMKLIEDTIQETINKTN